MSPQLVEAACLAGASWSYRCAVQVLTPLSGAQISAEELRLLTNAQGRLVAATQQVAPAQLAEAGASANCTILTEKALTHHIIDTQDQHIELP